MQGHMHHKRRLLIALAATGGLSVGMASFAVTANAASRTFVVTVVGNIKNSLAALLPLLTQRLAGRADAYAALREAARREQKARRARLAAAAEAAFDAPVIAPLVAAREIAGAMGVPARRIDRARDIAPALEAGIASHTANLVEIPLSTDH